MQLQKILVPAASVGLVAAAYQAYGWRGVAIATGALVMWLLLHFTRMMQVLRRAANQPIGAADSVVMLHARLQPGATLLHVIALTRSLGALQAGKNQQPEIFRWTDASGSHVTCEFLDGKLKKWDLVRPVQTDNLPADPAHEVDGRPAP